MQHADPIVISWALEPSVLIGVFFWTLGYIFLTGPMRKRAGWGPPVSPARQIAFYTGTLLFLAALVSPLDSLADEYLFSAHMLQHLLLMVGVAPLWIMGLPDWLLDRVIAPRPLRWLFRALTRAIPAFFIFNLVMLVWHLPSLYDAALENESLHIIEHLTFLFAAGLGWWPVLGQFPQAAPRLPLHYRIFYLFLMMFPSTLLAVLITFGRSPLYPFYAHVPRLWGLTVDDDQQIAGLLMWTLGNLIFFIAFAVTFFQWFQRQSSGEQPAT